MNIQKDIEALLRLSGQYIEMQGVIPGYLEQGYARLGVIETIRESGVATPTALAALMRVIVADDEEEVREAALSVLCEICEDNSVKRIALLLASADQNERVLTTVLEQSNLLDVSFAKEVASRLVTHPDPVVSKYASGIVSR
jgi:hypothetical protein